MTAGDIARLLATHGVCGEMIALVVGEFEAFDTRLRDAVELATAPERARRAGDAARKARWRLKKAARVAGAAVLSSPSPALAGEGRGEGVSSGEPQAPGGRRDDRQAFEKEAFQKEASDKEASKTLTPTLSRESGRGRRKDDPVPVPSASRSCRVADAPQDAPLCRSPFFPQTPNYPPYIPPDYTGLGAGARLGARAGFAAVAR